LTLKKVDVSKLKLVHVINEDDPAYTGFLATGYKDFDEKEGVSFIVSGIRNISFADNRSNNKFLVLKISPNGFTITTNGEKDELHVNVSFANQEAAKHFTYHHLIIEWNTKNEISIRPDDLMLNLICIPDSKRRRVKCFLD